jgi:hypothetical protein
MQKQRQDEFKPTFVDMTYLCPKDPNYQKIKDAEGWVETADGAPTHLGGFITDIKYTDEKKRTYAQDGRQIEFVVKHKSAKWTCSTCGSEKVLDPYPV